MSSIISDIFYGSKQNLLDNYLINRNQPRQAASKSQQESSPVCTPFIQLKITIPDTSNLARPQSLQVSAEMGRKTDENILQVPQSNSNSLPSVLLTLTDLQKHDLNKYTNIKLTISEGKYKSKVIGYIPIESIKSLISCYPPEKVVTLQMKGKKFIGFNTVQCTIRAQFPSNNILNSQILRSVDRQSYSEVSKQGNGNRQEGLSGLSKQSNIEMMEYSGSFEKVAKRQSRRGQRQDFSKGSYERSISSNIYIEDHQPRNTYKSTKPIAANRAQPHYTNYLSSLKLVLFDLKLTKPQQSQQTSQMYLVRGQAQYSLDQVIEFANLTKEGINLQVRNRERCLGNVFISPLMITVQDLRGELPIYGPGNKCVGTVRIRGTHSQQQKLPYFHQPVVDPKKPQAINKKIQKQPCTTLIALNIQKIILINCQSLNDTPINSSVGSYPFSFSKIESKNELQLLVHLQDQCFKFVNLNMRDLVNQQAYKIVEIRRKEGFFLSYEGEVQEEQIRLQVELYIGKQLLAIGSISVQNRNGINYVFVPGYTEYQYCQCAFAFQILYLNTPQSHFTNTKLIFDIINDVLTNKIVLSDLTDSTLKHVISHHKRATYIQTKKLFLLFDSIFPQLFAYQKSHLRSLRLQNFELSQHFIKYSGMILREMISLDTKGEQCVDRDEFQKIVEFYRREHLVQEGDEFKHLNENVIVGKDGKVVYPFYVAGFFLQKQKVEEFSYHHSETKNQKLQTQPQIYVKQVPSLKQIAVLSQPLYFIQKIALTNLHLLNNGKIPNISLSICKKIHYSNTNPIFIIQKDINIIQSIKIYHRNITTDELILLGEVQLNRRQINYELDITGKARMKVDWG